jgi:hypothetical protein
LISFKEIAAIIADRWKNVDPVTKEYVDTVAGMQKDRYYELKGIEALRSTGIPERVHEVPSERLATSQRRSNREVVGTVQATATYAAASSAVAHSTTSVPSNEPLPPLYYGYPPPSATDWQHTGRRGQAEMDSFMDSSYSNPRGRQDSFRLAHRDSREHNHFDNNHREVPSSHSAQQSLAPSGGMDASAHGSVFDEADVSDGDIMETYHSTD